MIIHRNYETIEISDIDEDVLWSVVEPDSNGIYVNFIQWVPGAADDVLIARNGNQADSPVVYYNKAASVTSDLPRYFYGALVQLFVDYSECTLSAGGRLIIQKMPVGGSFIK